METFTLPAFAKINWTLRILGRRMDGYHELLTVFQTVSLHDDLTFSQAPDDSISLTCDEADIPTGKDNLIVRAAGLMRLRFGVSKGMTVHLKKRIPAAGGLGGGSSDAAIAMLGVARLWNIELTKNDLEEMGAQLGADVPFFFTGGTALGEGRGTGVSSMADVASQQLVIITPNVKVSTADAYKALNSPALTKDGADTILSSSRLRGEFTDSLYDSLTNDFEGVIFGLEPEILRARDVLVREGARDALLAGSGASVFGIFDSVRAQERAAGVIRSESNWRVFKCATVSRGSYLKELGDCAAPLLDGFPSAGRFDIGA